MMQAERGLRMSLVSPLLAVFFTLLAADAKTEEIRQFRDWQLVETGSVCRIVSVVTSRATGSLLLEVSLIPEFAEESSYLIAVRVPLGASLASGIALRHAGQDRVAIGLEWLSCDPEMCTAGGKLSGAAIAALRRGNSVFVGFRPMIDARPVNIELSLMGFTAASNALQTCGPA